MERVKKIKIKEKASLIGNNIFKWTLWSIMLLWCILFLALLLWGFANSLKDEFDWYRDKNSFPRFKYLDWQNYTNVFSALSVNLSSTRTVGFFELLTNTLIYSVGNAVLAQTTALMATYILVRYKGAVKGVGILWTVYLIVRYMPVSSSLASELKLLKTLGFFDNFVGLFIYNAGCFGGAFLIYYGLWKGISPTLAEAAELDGAGQLRIFVQIMVPMVASTYVFFIINSVIGFWDDYKGPMVYLPSHPTLSYAIWRIQFSVETNLNNVPAKLAGLLLLSVPPFVLFLCIRKKALEGVSAGSGIKG